MKKFISLAGDTAPYLIVGLVFIVTVSALISLVLVDVITGQIAGDYLSKDWKFGLFTSLAGTGMLIACGVLIKSLWDREAFVAMFAVAVVFLVLQAADVYFDAISVDIKRFGFIMDTSTLNAQEALAHNVYRFFVAGISFVGEPLGVGSLVAFPLLKKWLVDILEISERKSNSSPAKPKFHQNKSKYVPKHKPSHLNAFHSIKSPDEELQKPPWMP